MDENFFGITDTGKVRSNNEDTFITETVDGGRLILACVIDGVGGYSGGEVAAELARKSILDHFKNTVADKDKIDFLRQALLSANAAVYGERLQNAENNQMACVVTLVIADVADNKIYYAHVGDTRLYLFRDNTLVKISHDHSFVGFLEDSGRLTEAEAMGHSKRNEINKALGFDGTITSEDYIETGQSPFLPGDVIMLCSDGLSDMIDRNAMMTILNNNSSLKKQGKLLIEAANNAGGNDNVTVVLVKNDKSVQQHTATKPVASDSKTGTTKAEAITTEYRAPNTAQPKPVYKSSGAVPILSILLVLLLVACGWLFYQYWQNKREAKTVEPVTTPAQVKRGEREQLLMDSLNNPAVKEVFIVNSPGDQPFTISDSISINSDSVHIIGNGVTFSASDLFKGPAFIIPPTAKYILVENVVFQNFDLGILSQSNALHFKNVTFVDCKVPVQSTISFPENTGLNGHIVNMIAPATDSISFQTTP